MFRCSPGVRALLVLTDDTSKRQVTSVVEALVTVGHKELKKSGVFLVPGFAKVVVIKKPATKERKGINNFHQGTDRLQGEARSEGPEGSAGQGRQGRDSVVPRNGWLARPGGERHPSSGRATKGWKVFPAQFFDNPRGVWA